MHSIRTKEAGPWLPRESARPLLAWSTEQLDALAAALGGAIAQWREAWGLAPVATAPSCEAADSEWVVRAAWRTLGDAAGRAWLHAPADGAEQLACMLFGEQSASAPAAAEVTDGCARDALRRVAQVLRLAEAEAAPEPVPAGLGLSWSGAVQALLPGTPGWCIVVSAEAMHAWSGHAGVRAARGEARAPREPLCTAAEALGGRTVPLRVELTGCELDLGTLQGLQIGDVVPLRHQLQAPARLVDADGKVLFDGYLVASHGRKAFELAKPPTH